ncbi:MAG: cell division protein FtsQ/DivIB [Thiomicrorhabdus sp.]|nr:cell division protein FtsQ/DivIB [Thiomicrorhabdus sp.]
MKRLIIITVFSLVLMSAWGVSWLFTDKNAPLFKPIEHYQFAGEFTYVKPKELNQVLGRYLGHSFWAVELDVIQSELMRLDWVNQALVKRRWPNQLYVVIEEQTPFARWSDVGLVTQDGEVFYPKNREGFEHLVQVKGEPSESKKILATLETFQQELSKIDFSIDSLTHEMDGVWRVELLNGSKIILDSKESAHAISRFTLAYPQLAESLRKSPQVYDLRYSNGFIVGNSP